jgi:hypothetical protein
MVVMKGEEERERKADLVEHIHNLLMFKLYLYLQTATISRAVE